MDSTTLFDSSPSMKKVGKAALSRWKMETLTGLLGLDALQKHQNESQKNQRAENQHVRKSVWGADDANQSDDEDMRNIVLGDVNHPTPIIMPQPQSNSFLPTAALLLLTVAPLAGAVGYLLAKPAPTPVVIPDPAFDDETVSIGLGRIQDYMSDPNQ